MRRRTVDRMELRIGGHVDQADPVAEAAARGATLSQFFLGDPQSYKGPVVRFEGGPAALREEARAAGVDLYVHAPYPINVASSNNRMPTNEMARPMAPLISASRTLSISSWRMTRQRVAPSEMRTEISRPR